MSCDQTLGNDLRGEFDLRLAYPLQLKIGNHSKFRIAGHQRTAVFLCQGRGECVRVRNRVVPFQQCRVPDFIGGWYFNRCRYSCG